MRIDAVAGGFGEELSAKARAVILQVKFEKNFVERRQEFVKWNAHK